HLGTPQTSYEIYKKELWHGIGTLQVFLNDIRKVRNLRPVIYSAFYGLCLVGGLLSLIVSLLTQDPVALTVLSTVILIALMVPFGLAIAALRGRRQYKLLFGLAVVYLSYGIGRAVCLFRFLSRKEKWNGEIESPR
ncbi:MAG: hypothetical protein ACFFCW_48635, partial [Candidatus Hodarchaeota archaeon]